MPELVAVLAIVIAFMLVAALALLINSPEQRRIKSDLKRDAKETDGGARLDRNHHEMYLLLTEMSIRDSYATPIFSNQDQERVTSLLAAYRKEITA